MTPNKQCRKTTQKQESKILKKAPIFSVLENNIHKLNPQILEHNVNVLGLEKRGNDWTYEDLVNLIQIQQGRENISQACKALFDYITKEKLNEGTGRQRIEKLFYKSTNGAYTIARPDQFEQIIDSNPRLKAINEKLKKDTIKGILPGGFIHQAIYFTMVEQKIIPLADQHDLFSHLINFSDPVVARQTNKMVELYGKLLDYCSQHKDTHGIVDFRTLEQSDPLALVFGVIDTTRGHLQEENPKLVGKIISMIGAASSNNPYAKTHKSVNDLLLSIYSHSIKQPYHFYDLKAIYSKNTQKFLQKEFGKTTEQVSNEMQDIFWRIYRKHEIQTNGLSFIERYATASQYALEEFGEYKKLLEPKVREAYIDAILKDVEFFLEKSHHTT